MNDRGLDNEQYHNYIATVFDKHINCDLKKKI